MKCTTGLWIATMPLLSSAAHSEVFTIAKPQFSVMVLDDANYSVVGPAVDNTISKAKLTQGLVYFSFTVIGTDKAVEYLRQKGRMEVDAVIYADGERRDTIHIGIEQENWRSGIAEINPYADRPFKLRVSVTASNQRGMQDKEFELPFVSKSVAAADLFDLTTLGLHVPIPMDKVFREAVGKDDSFLQILVDEDDDDVNKENEPIEYRDKADR